MVPARKERRRRKKRKGKEMKSEMSGLEFPQKIREGQQKFMKLPNYP